MFLGQELKFKNKLCNLKLGTFFSALPGQRPGLDNNQQGRPERAKALNTRSFCSFRATFFVEYFIPRHEKKEAK